MSIGWSSSELRGVTMIAGRRACEPLLPPHPASRTTLRIVLEAATQGDRIVSFVPQALVEAKRRVVGRPHLQVHLRAAGPAEQPLDLRHQPAPEAATAVRRGDGEVVDPAAVAVVAGRHRRDDSAAVLEDEEPLTPDAERARDVLARIIQPVFRSAAAMPAIERRSGSRASSSPPR
jgi:hypothetical protein